MYAILRLAKHSTNGSLGAMKKHNKREMPVPNADPEKTKFNREIVGTGDYVKDVNEIIAKSGVHAQKNSVKAIEHVMTATPEFFHYSKNEMKIEDKDERNKAYWERYNLWIDANVKFLQEHYGPHSRVASVSLHKDELTPHLHAFVVPITQGKLKGGKVVNRLGAKEFTGDTKGVSGKKKLSLMQDKYAEAMKGFGLDRGIKNSKAQHQTMKKLHTNMARAEEYIKNKTYEIPLIENTPPLVGREKWVQNQNEEIKEKMQSFIDNTMLETSRNAFLSAAEILRLSKRKQIEEREGIERAELINKTIKAIETHKGKAVSLELINTKLSQNLEAKTENIEKWQLNYKEAKSDIQNLINGTITPERLEVLKFEIKQSERSRNGDNERGFNMTM